MLLNEGLKGYIAGLVDGEGTIFIGRQKREENRSGYRFLPHLIITNTNKECLDLCKNIFNFGSLFLRREASFNKDGAIQSRKNCYRWEVKHQLVGVVLREILPYMVIKKKQAENILLFLESLETQGNYSKYDPSLQFKYYAISKELNGNPLTEEEKIELLPIMREVKLAEIKHCFHEGCEDKHYGNGLCRKHWKRKRYAEKKRT